jgi:hypothetical protein
MKNYKQYFVAKDNMDERYHNIVTHEGTHTSLHLALSFVLEGVNLVWKM